jgi:uncharacterized protein
MGALAGMTPSDRVVFDTNVVLSALLFRNGKLAWLRAHWAEGRIVTLVSRFTIMELTQVLAQPKFKLTADYRAIALMLYLPYCQSVDSIESCPLICRDPKDQPFLDLAYSGIATVLVTGDQDLLSLSGRAAFAIETPEQYRRRLMG